MTTTDLLPDFLDYLAAACQAAPALEGVTVLDGQPPSGAIDGIEQVLWVGHDPKAAAGAIGKAEQDFAFLDHARTRDETGSVTCAAKHWSGDITLGVHRDGCKAIVGAVELLLRGDAASAGPGDASAGGVVFWAGTTAFTWYQGLAVGGGAEAVCVFEVAYRGRVFTT